MIKEEMFIMANVINKMLSSVIMPLEISLICFIMKVEIITIIINRIAIIVFLICLFNFKLYYFSSLGLLNVRV